MVYVHVHWVHILVDWTGQLLLRALVAHCIRSGQNLSSLDPLVDPSVDPSVNQSVDPSVGPIGGPIGEPIGGPISRPIGGPTSGPLSTPGLNQGVWGATKILPPRGVGGTVKYILPFQHHLLYTNVSSPQLTLH